MADEVPPSSSGGSGNDESPASADEIGGGSGGHAVICGAGVIGACTAFFLAKKGLRVTVVERCSVASAASGKAGGFLALDWCDGSALGKLARASFILHQRLADELNGVTTYGYRRLETLSVVLDEPRDGAAEPSPPSPQPLPSWMDGPARGATPIGSPATTAQVHPADFTRTVLEAASARYGTRVIQGCVQEIKLDSYRMKAIGVVVDKSFVAADVVVVAMGPWSGLLSPVSNLVRISGRKAHSIVIRPRSPAAPITAHALLLRYKTREGKQLAPEVYPRPTGEVYVSGMSEEAELPATADEVKPRSEATDMLRRVAENVSSHFRGAVVEATQACFMPLSEDGRPLIGKLPNMDGAYIATGHGYWGVLNAPATGAFLSELIVDGDCKTLDLKYFDPARFIKFRSRRKGSFSLN